MDDDQGVLPEREALDKILRGCGAGALNDSSACCGLAGLRAAGWKIEHASLPDGALIIVARPPEVA